jgi:acyl-homoserine-lactone acylase
MYWSKYGPTVITDRGTFSIRTAPLFDIRGLEQWYRMNKARNFTEFYKALKMEALPGYNVMYADRYDTIFYMSNGKIPLRNKGFNWRGTLPGNTSATLWNTYHPIEDLPHYLNPASGYLFNSNHSPFNASSKADNLNVRNFDATMGFETWENNRSVRFMDMMKPLNKLNYVEFKKVKFDRQLPTPLRYIGSNTDTLFMLDENKHPDIADLITILKQWDKKASVESTGAAAFTIMYYYITSKLAAGDNSYRNLTTEKAVDIISFAKKYLLDNFGKTNVQLGEYQKLVRGDKVLPLPGLPDVIASMESEPYKNGMVKGRTGESFIQLVKFTKSGPVIESIHSYGASKKPGHPHYNDQMEMFIAQQLKPMTLNKQEVYASAEKVYHPGN